jgi:hypothetical protein
LPIRGPPSSTPHDTILRDAGVYEFPPQPGTRTADAKAKQLFLAVYEIASRHAGKHFAREVRGLKEVWEREFGELEDGNRQRPIR